MLPLHTTNAQLDILEATFFQHIRSRPNEFDADLSHVQIYDIEDMERIKLVFHTVQRTSWQNAGVHTCMSACLHAVDIRCLEGSNLLAGT